MYTTILLTLTPTSSVRASTTPDGMAVRLELGARTRVGIPTAGVTIALPSEDDEALVLLDLFSAAIDNAVSAVRIRQDRREGAALEGAGASVEAYRG